ncbi:PREDICTED: uncharacterized protein LOC108757960 [Trachymyrmex cornetzi]|uniref:uncharacterized protein LOC108757960 n=1 Tax=Trachymyrmex cornetzi TaxID=471704 RepID=UPI00084F7D69|nr:PREDICTED: uncharacterized protein LOC108757960 [Trachymyrmex cornetzi]
MSAKPNSKESPAEPDNMRMPRGSLPAVEPSGDLEFFPTGASNSFSPASPPPHERGTLPNIPIHRGILVVPQTTDRSVQTEPIIQICRTIQARSRTINQSIQTQQPDRSSVTTSTLRLSLRSLIQRRLRRMRQQRRRQHGHSDSESETTRDDEEANKRLYNTYN